jgi:hypothetical protein
MMKMQRRTLPALLLLIATPATCAIAAGPETSEAQRPTCVLAAAETAWVQQALDSWGWVLVDALRHKLSLPWIVLFDSTCVWELGVPGAEHFAAAGIKFDGAPVAVRARAHDGTVTLPNGKELPAAPIAAGFLLENGRGSLPFFALASVDLWRERTPAGEWPELERFFLGVAVHEMVHTLQLVELQRRVEALEEQFEMPAELDDDVVQHVFGEIEGFRTAFESERDLLYRAVLAVGDAESRALAAEALERLSERRAQYYRGDNAVYAELEDLFLNLEGLAVWSHFQLALASPAVRFFPDFESTDPKRLIEHARQRQGYWSQEAGFALILLLERLVSGWRQPLIEELASPVELLRAALDAAEAERELGNDIQAFSLLSQISRYSRDKSISAPLSASPAPTRVP